MFFLFINILWKHSKRAALIMIDGIGESGLSESNNVLNSYAPNLDHFKKIFPYTPLISSQQSVGLTPRESGSSIDYQTIGLGRNVPSYVQSLEKSLNKKSDNSIFSNKLLRNSIEFSSKNNGHLHLFGSCNKDSIFIHLKYLRSILEVAKDYGMKEVFMHCSMCTLSQTLGSYLIELEDMAPEGLKVTIASIHSSDESMDEYSNWTKTGITYSALLNASSARIMKREKFLEDIGNEPYPIFPSTYFDPAKGHDLKSNDTLIIFNFREDKTYQIAAALLKGHQFLALKEHHPEYDQNFQQSPEMNCIFKQQHHHHFHHHHRPLNDDDSPLIYCKNTNSNLTKNVKFQPGDFREKIPDGVRVIPFVVYGKDLIEYPTLFPAIYLNNSLGKVISDNGFKQIRISEQYKSSHVTKYFSGGILTDIYPGEYRMTNFKSIPSSQIQFHPEMNSSMVKDAIIDAIHSEKFKLIVANFGNIEATSHTGNLTAIINSISLIDNYIAQIQGECDQHDTTLFITSNYEDFEEGFDLDGNPHLQTVVTSPFIVLSNSFKIQHLPLGKVPSLANIAPSILTVLNIPIPSEMQESILVPSWNLPFGIHSYIFVFILGAVFSALIIFFIQTLHSRQLQSVIMEDSSSLIQPSYHSLRPFHP